MTVSAGDGLHGFFAFYRVYAQTGIHAASTAILTALIGLAGFVNVWFLVLGIAVYAFPPVFLYLTGEGDRVPTVVGDENRDDGTTDAEDEPDSESGDSDVETDSAVAGGSTGTDTADEPDSDTEPGWTETDTPTDQSLLDVVTSQNGAYAVGEGGIVLARNDDDWETVLERGPTAESNSLRGVDATEDGRTVWFAGDSGVLGRYDGEQLTDHSAPADQTSTWTDIAVTGETGEERIYLVNGSGELIRGAYSEGSVEWGDIEKPGSGSSISSIEFVNGDRGYLCDTNQGVYETTDGGKNWEAIGIEDASATFTGIAATDSTVVVAGDDGSVFRYDGAVWTRLHAGGALSAIDLVGETGLAVGDGGGVYEHMEESWESVETPVDADLQGTVIGPNDSERTTDVAVGSDGTVIERYR